MPTLREIAATGDRLATLTAVRQALAASIDSCDSARDMPALTRQLAAVLEQIAVLSPSKKVDAVDEIAKRRTSRRSSTSSGKTRASRSV